MHNTTKTCQLVHKQGLGNVPGMVWQSTERGSLCHMCRPIGSLHRKSTSVPTHAFRRNECTYH
ncbi:hypothetical protein GBAR_LOCUS10163 [Geodia barretti]|uniref:Uncharacterized protein n=1 Tax=Geodia barretti TaxID=519541 RepID=A0AA35RRU3_GEOBA|nr:hypothetical protein GBAR_LOCUS10163 [Geodia barretti]